MKRYVRSNRFVKTANKSNSIQAANNSTNSNDYKIFYVSDDPYGGFSSTMVYTRAISASSLEEAIYKTFYELKDIDSDELDEIVGDRGLNSVLDLNWRNFYQEFGPDSNSIMYITKQGKILADYSGENPETVFDSVKEYLLSRYDEDEIYHIFKLDVTMPFTLRNYNVVY